MPQMSSHILDMIYNILKLSVSAQSLTLKRTLSSTQSTDPTYITKVVQASKSFADVQSKTEEEKLEKIESEE